MPFLKSIIFLLLFVIPSLLLADANIEIPRVGLFANTNNESSVPTVSNVLITNAQQIAATGSSTFTDFLTTQSMVQLSGNNASNSQSAVSIRGFGENAAANSLILIDGYRFTNPDLSAPNLNAVLIPDIESIEVIPGSQGVLYGDQAVGGVLKITTKKPEKFTLKLQTGYGSYDQQLYSAYIGDKLHQGFSYQISGLFNKTRNYRDHNNESLNDFNGRLLYDYQQGSAFLRYQYFKNHFLYPGPLTTEQVATNPRQSIYEQDDNRVVNHIYELSLKHFFNENWSLLADLSHREINSDGFYMSHYREKERINALDARVIGVSKRHTLTMGTYLEQDSDWFANAGLYNDAKQWQQNLFIQDVINLLPQLELSVGGRSAFQQNALQANRESSHYHVHDQVNVWELGLSYRFNPAWRVYVRRDGNFRFPRTGEQQFTPDNINHLNAQTGVSYESGVEWQRPGKSIKASVYHLVINNEIAFDPTQTPLQPLGANRNLSRTVRDGMTLTGQFAVNTALDVSGQYTYVNPRFVDGPFKHNRIPGVANNNASLGLFLRFLEHCKLYAGVTYSGQQYAISDDANEGRKISGVWLSNLGLQYDYQNFNFNLRVNNIFNKLYNNYTVFSSGTQANSYYPAAGRNFLLTVGYQID